MQRIIDIIAIPGSAFVGFKATTIIWPIDQWVAITTGLAFTVLFFDFLLDVLDPERKRS